MKPKLRIVCSLAIVVAELATPIASASVSPAARSPQSFVFTREPDFSRGMDASAIQPMRSLNGMRYEDISKFIPSDLSPTMSGGMISGRIAERSLYSFFNSPAMRSSELGRSAHSIDNKMKGGVSLSGSGEKSLHHEFKFAMRPSQARAVVQYSGLTDAQVSYQAMDSKLDFEVRESVSAIGTQVVFNHIAQRGDNTDMLSMRWAW
jgi:hypothetical protein